VRFLSSTVYPKTKNLKKDLKKNYEERYVLEEDFNSKRGYFLNAAFRFRNTRSYSRGIKVQLKERIYSNKEYIRERTPLFGSFIAD
jgi:hypothetical protein